MGRCTSCCRGACDEAPAAAGAAVVCEVNSHQQETAGTVAAVCHYYYC